MFAAFKMLFGGSGNSACPELIDTYPIEFLFGRVYISSGSTNLNELKNGDQIQFTCIQYPSSITPYDYYYVANRANGSAYFDLKATPTGAVLPINSTRSRNYGRLQITCPPVNGARANFIISTSTVFITDTSSTPPIQNGNIVMVPCFSPTLTGISSSSLYYVSDFLLNPGGADTASFKLRTGPLVNSPLVVFGSSAGNNTEYGAIVK